MQSMQIQNESRESREATLIAVGFLPEEGDMRTVKRCSNRGAGATTGRGTSSANYHHWRYSILSIFKKATALPT